MIHHALATYFPRHHWPHYRRPYSFSADWFTPRIPSWRKRLRHWAAQPSVRALEIGTFEGRSALWLLENILIHQTSRLVCIDTFPPEIFERFRANLELGGFRSRTEVHAAPSQSTLKLLESNTFDLIYVDGGHSAAQVLLDARLSWPLLKNGGILIFDDYRWGLNQPDCDRPKPAVDQFLFSLKGAFEFLEIDYQIIIRKHERGTSSKFAMAVR